MILRMRHSIVSAPAPPSFVWPDATNTGVQPGITLTTYTGSYNVTANGTLIENKIMNDQLNLLGNNITVRNCRITNSEYFGIRGADGGATLTIEYCTIHSTAGGNAAIASRGIIRNNKLTGFENGIVVEDGASTITGNYIAELFSDAEAHPDGIAMHGAQNGVLIEDNTIFAMGTSAVFLKADFSTSNNVTINHNLCRQMPGQTYGYAIYDDGNVGQNTNVRITNNHLERGWAAYITLDNSTAVVSGNVDYLTGAPVGA